MARAVVEVRRAKQRTRLTAQATTHFNDPVRLAQICTGLGMSMKGESLEAHGSIRTAGRGY